MGTEWSVIGAMFNKALVISVLLGILLKMGEMVDKLSLSLIAKIYTLITLFEHCKRFVAFLS